LVATATAVTCAAAITAPEASTHVPSKSPLMACAPACREQDKKYSKVIAAREQYFLSFS